MLSHRTAAELDKLTDEISELVHVMIPAERRVYMTVGILVHRSSRATEALHPAHAPPRTRIEETILDLTETAATLDEVVSWVACGLGRRRTVPAKLRLAMEQRATLRWRRELAELLSDEIRGVHSALEHRYVRDVERPHSLPRGERQALVKRNGRSQYRDVLYQVYCLLVELDGCSRIRPSPAGGTSAETTRQRPKVSRPCVTDGWILRRIHVGSRPSWRLAESARLYEVPPVFPELPGGTDQSPEASQLAATALSAGVRDQGQVWLPPWPGRARPLIRQAGEAAGRGPVGGW